MAVILFVISIEYVCPLTTNYKHPLHSKNYICEILYLFLPPFNLRSPLFRRTILRGSRGVSSADSQGAVYSREASADILHHTAPSETISRDDSTGLACHKTTPASPENTL